MKKDPIIERNNPVHFTFSLFFQKVLWNLLAFHYKSNELRKSVLSISHLKRVAVYIFADKANEEFQKKSQHLSILMLIATLHWKPCEVNLNVGGCFSESEQHTLVWRQCMQ